MVRPSAVITPMTRRSAPTPSEPIAAAPDEPAPPSASAPKPDFAPVIRSKIQPPALRADTLTRDRLIRQLRDAAASRVTLVTADAGYGKTTLLADFAARSGYQTIWYRLTPTDVDEITWVNHLLAACRELDPLFGGATTSLLSDVAVGGPTSNSLLDSFLGELGRWRDAPAVFVLDDFHEVDRAAEACRIVTRVIENAPPWLRFMIASRRRPTIELGRIAAMGELAEVVTDDLRFSSDETARLFAECYSQPLESEVLKHLDSRTRGWAASLQLFHGSIRGRPAAAIRSLAESLSGASSPIYDFLAEEVLGNLPDDIAAFLLRASVMDRVSGRYVRFLFDEESRPPTDLCERWIEECFRLSLLSRSSEYSEVFLLHPLLRDFLSRQLQSRISGDQARAIHQRLARAMRDMDPLSACHHYIEGGQEQEAMDTLGASVMTTMGSGQWGVASDLIDRLRAVPARPAVAAMRARQLTADGNPAAAERLLRGFDLTECSPEVRAVVRQTWLALGWRTGDRTLLQATLAEIGADPETPEVLRDIAELFVDSGSLSPDEAKPLPDLAQRLLNMAESQRRAGHGFYSAVSLHNASVAYLNAGEYQRAIDAGEAALSAFHALGFEPSEVASTHSILSTCLFELGRNQEAFEQANQALRGNELADVPAELAIVHASLGLRDKALEYLRRSEALTREGRTDTGALPLLDAARAVVMMPASPIEAVQLLSGATADWPLDMGQVLHRRSQLATAHLLAGEVDVALEIAVSALSQARDRSERRAAARFAIIQAVAGADGQGLISSMSNAASGGRLAMAELADVICEAIRLIPVGNESLDSAIREAPSRWLPALRRQLRKGAPHGHHAAILLDRHGEFEDVGLLRAFAKTYKRRGVSAQLGIDLSRRTSPRLLVQDLGRVQLQIGERGVALSGMRRKAAALLMYLVTQPSLTANKEEVLDTLWPDADPDSATNSLNQTLYFLRREIDPWYEDEFSVDYVLFGGDLVWLDASLVSTESGEFLKEASAIRRKPDDAGNAIELIRRYRGHFAPEFEYEEWAMDWRSRVHSVLLDLAHASIGNLRRSGDLADAREVAIALLDIDPTATDIERHLIWLLWHTGASSAAKAQYEHLARIEARDGIEAESFTDIVTRNGTSGAP